MKDVFPRRICNLLNENGIMSLNDIMNTNPIYLVGIRGISVKTFSQIVNELEKYNFKYCTKWQIHLDKKYEYGFIYLSWSA